MVNFTICLSGLIETHQQMVVSALNIPLSVTAFLGDLLIIVALQKPSSLHPPSKLLLGCLASTDLCVGLIIQPLFVTFLMSSQYKLCYYVRRIFSTTVSIFCGVSLMTLTAISVDRLLALMLGLRYRHVVTLRRVWFLVASFCLYHVSISAILYFNENIVVNALCIGGDIVHNNLNLLLLENIFQTSPTSRSSWKPSTPRTTERRRDWNQYSTLQEDGVQYTIGANDLTSLLSANGFNNSCCCFKWTANTVSIPGCVCIIFVCVVKLISKPVSLLLEDEGSEASGQGHD